MYRIGVCGPKVSVFLSENKRFLLIAAPHAARNVIFDLWLCGGILNCRSTVILVEIHLEKTRAAHFEERGQIFARDFTAVSRTFRHMKLRKQSHVTSDVSRVCKHVRCLGPCGQSWNSKRVIFLSKVWEHISACAPALFFTRKLYEMQAAEQNLDGPKLGHAKPFWRTSVRYKCG